MTDSLAEPFVQMLSHLIMTQGNSVMCPRPLLVIISVLKCVSIFISLSITATLVFSQNSKERSDHYVGAVVEYAPTESDAFESPKEVI